MDVDHLNQFCEATCKKSNCYDIEECWVLDMMDSSAIIINSSIFLLLGHCQGLEFDDILILKGYKEHYFKGFRQ